LLQMCLAAVITAVGLTYAVSETYTASTQVLIRPHTSMNLVPKRAEILNFPVSFYTPIETASKTYTEIIQSRAVAERVVKRLGIDTLGEPKGSGFVYTVKESLKRAKKLARDVWTVLKYGRIEKEDKLG